MVALFGAIVSALALDGGATPTPATACAFDPLRPATYEADALRERYLLVMSAAASNQLFPGDPYFELPAVEVGTRANRSFGASALPVEILRAIGWVESSMTMASRSTPFEAIGPALVSFDCGHGIMQVTSGMTVPLGAGGQPTSNQIAVATSDLHNVARGASILASKWNDAPGLRPIAGTNTNADPTIIENWYYAVWAYNGFTGPGSRQSNHPLDPNLAWPRSAYRCDGTQSRTRYPYQELVYGCVANPAERAGRDLWAAVPVSLPDLTNPQFFNAMRLASFEFPYNGMDIPTPSPSHRTTTPQLPANIRATLAGSPQLSVNAGAITIHTNGTPHQARATIRIANPGSGVLSWFAKPSDNFLIVDPPAGSAVGSGVRCTASGCPNGEITVSINPTLLPASRASGTITITSPNASGSTTIRVQVVAEFEVAAPGTSRAP